eukprot:CAMPEP_0202703766 /NCGR_PEP_ID=MMETSP1385-20130828/16570_1 /ASSEMBLY_ACC=CAM_ASM_000861 /TAXON_ID=933848 /ORGANISM="Elphidium margaritaceum" /LENGTH=156 /DNA_ID=CAMNT_0049361669 /DNA_START=98 /DNA_END=568 /DNA_ORIENTATION=-
MTDIPPPSKRVRVDPNAMDDDILPPTGVSVLGKRKRKNPNEYLYNGDVSKVVKGAPTSHPQSGDQLMNVEQKNDDSNENENADDASQMPRVTNFVKGHQLDVKITDEHQETIWTSGIICKVQDDKILIHVPRSGAIWQSKTSDDIAPAGTFTDGLN